MRNFIGKAFWARGYFVSTVGLDEAMVRAHIRNQEAEDERYDQMKLDVSPPWAAHGFIGSFGVLLISLQLSRGHLTSQ